MSDRIQFIKSLAADVRSTKREYQTKRDALVSVISGMDTKEQREQRRELASLAGEHARAVEELLLRIEGL